MRVYYYVMLSNR